MRNTSCTRRTFVTRAAASACTLVATHRIAGQDITSKYTVPSSSTADAFLPEPVLAPDMRRLAVSAVEAAKHAGATYVDVRIGEQHNLRLSRIFGFVPPFVSMNSTLTYGVRVLVDGAWAFVHGSVPTIDAITTSAYNAVAMAKSYSPLVTHHVEFLQSPAVIGEWSTPFQEDPFSVPLRDHGAMMNTYEQIMSRVPQAGLSTESFFWIKETRVFASSDGTVTTQTLRSARPMLGIIMAEEVLGRVELRFPALNAASGGYETFANPTRFENEFLALAEQAARYAVLPTRTLDVGRYPIVMDGSTVGITFGSTMGAGLELDRVLGEEADASGTSYLSPPLELLGTQIANPKLTVTATRAFPMPSAVQWDDEGVTPHDYPVITDGHLVDYHTSRWTAPMLRAWYERNKQPIRSHGCTVAVNAEDPPAVRTPHLRISPSLSSTTVDTLCQDVKDGLLVIGVEEYIPDQQFASGSITGTNRNSPKPGIFLKIERGKIVGRIQGNGVEMSTRRFWKEQLVTLGNASTVQQMDFDALKGMPWRHALQTTSAPAALFKDVNVVAYRRSL